MIVTNLRNNWTRHILELFYFNKYLNFKIAQLIWLEYKFICFLLWILILISSSVSEIGLNNI